MAGDWIKMRRGLRHDPKVIAISRHLAKSDDFMKSCIDPSYRHVTENVTNTVTFGFVTRVTVCALLDVWASLNNSLGQDGRAPFMCLQDIDDIAEIPGFGEAMATVGWVIVNAAGGLTFPNFTENNNPSKSRPNKAKSDAERAKAYRERKAGKTTDSEPVTPSRHVTTEKRREEKILDTPLIPQGGDEGRKKVLPVGAEKWPARKQKTTRVNVNNARMIRIGGFFNRQPDTLWTVEEAITLSRLNLSESEIATVEEFYLAILPEDGDYRRRDLITLLNNWNGEHDRAVLWKNSK